MSCISNGETSPQIPCAVKDCSVNSHNCIECRFTNGYCSLFKKHGDIKFQANGKPFYHWRLIGTSGWQDEWDKPLHKIPKPKQIMRGKLRLVKNKN